MSSTSSPGLFRVRRWAVRLPVALVVGSLLATGWASSVSAATRPLTVTASIGSQCIDGRAKSNAFLRVIVRDSTGSIKGRSAETADASGYWEFCTYSQPILSGDRVNVLVFSTGQKRVFTIPRLSLTVDRVSDIVSGRGPSNSTLKIEAAGSTVLLDDYYDVIEKVTTDATGAYSFDFSSDGIDLIGGATLTITWKHAGGAVQVWRQAVVPYVLVSLGSADFYGATQPNRHIGITLTEGVDTVATGDAVGDSGIFYNPGEFTGMFVDADDDPYLVKGGEWLDAPALGSDGSFLIPAIGGTANLAADTVSGTCVPFGAYLVVATSANYYDYGVDYGVVAANGSFTAHLGSQMNLRRNADVQIYCVTTGGDVITQEFLTH
jgi:hypothetical protein